MADKSNRLTVYLIRDGLARDDGIMKDDAEGHALDGVGTFYTQRSRVRVPDWVSGFFNDLLGKDHHILSASSRGVLLTNASHGGVTRTFAVVFGHGRHLLKDGVTEERFGLKVVLNSVKRESLRSIDRTALGAVPKQSREQMSRESEASSFGIDVEQDLVNAVTGRSSDPRLGKTITGRDALSASVKVDVNDIGEFLSVCLERYLSDAYKKDFDWIDQIKDVRELALLARLNGWLVERLNQSELDKIWMAPPAIVDWVRVRGFRFSTSKKAATYDDLAIGELLQHLAGEEVTLDRLKSKHVYSIAAADDEVVEHWTAFRCLYAEAMLDERVFILNAGKWYEIAKGFTDKVIADFEAIPGADLPLPAYSHANEGAYNEAVPLTLNGAFCMDRKMVPHGGGRSTIEFCDLMTADNRLVHVKHYSGSAQLSHLFNQGVVSGELFAQDADFRKKVNEHLPDPLKLPDPDNRPDPAQYEVVFAIISKSDKPLDIPFFSKVSMRNAQRRLSGYGYKVTKKKVEVEQGTNAN